MSEQEQAPFLAGQTVKHKGGETGTVIRCEKRTAIGSVRWVVDITRPGQGRNAQWWASNCELVSDRPEWPKYFESAKTRGPEFRRRFVRPDSFGIWCDGTGVVDQTYEQAIKAVAEGALVEVDENGVEIVKQMEPEEAVDNLLVSNLVSALMRVDKFFSGTREDMRKEFESVVRKELGEHPKYMVPVVENVRKDHIELLRQQKIDAERALQDLVEEMKEHQAEFVRALASANRERDAARASASNRGRIIAEARTILSVVGLGFANDSDAATLEAVRTLVRKFVAAEARGDIVRKIIERNS